MNIVTILHHIKEPSNITRKCPAKVLANNDHTISKKSRTIDLHKKKGKNITLHSNFTCRHTWILLYWLCRSVTWMQNAWLCAVITASRLRILKHKNTVWSKNHTVVQLFYKNKLIVNLLIIIFKQPNFVLMHNESSNLLQFNRCDCFCTTRKSSNKFSLGFRNN